MPTAPASRPVREGGLPTPARVVLVGVLNVTPDSFSDGGRHLDPEEAVRFGLQLVADGADIVDVGGESTRPGAERVSAEEERRRVEPVVRGLAAEGVLVSIDTMRAVTAEAAVAAGARVVNDVSGGTADPAMFSTVAAAGVPYVLTHSRGPSRDMASRAVYADVVHEVCDELRVRLDEAVAAGVDAANVVLDPGIGFAKLPEHNWAILTRLSALRALGRPLLVGVSRKSFLAALLADPRGERRPFDQLDVATTALTALLALQGVWGVRVHDVAGSADAARVASAWRAAAAGR